MLQGTHEQAHRRGRTWTSAALGQSVVQGSTSSPHLCSSWSATSGGRAHWGLRRIRRQHRAADGAVLQAQRLQKSTAVMPMSPNPTAGSPMLQRRSDAAVLLAQSSIVGMGTVTR